MDANFVKQKIAESYNNLLKFKQQLSQLGESQNDPLYALNPFADGRYYLDDSYLMVNPKLFVSKISSLELWPRHASILELGIGSGNFAKEIITQCHPIEYTGVDLDINAINSIQKIIRDELYDCQTNISIEHIDAITYLKKSINSNKKYDIIYVDDLHSFAHVCAEIELAKQLIKSGSIIVFNDYRDSFSSHEICGVKSSVRKLLKENKDQFKILYYCIEDADLAIYCH